MDGYLPISRLVWQPVRAQSGDMPPPDLLLVDGIANGEALATLGATAAQDGTAPAVFHAGHETMLVDTLTIVRLECSFHDKTFFFAKF